MATDGLKRQRTLVGSTGPTDWTPSGDYLACGNKSGGIGLWNAHTGKRVWESNFGTPSKFSLLRDGLSLAASDQHIAVIMASSLLIVKLDNGDLEQVITLPDGLDYSGRWSEGNMSWSQDGKLLAIAGDGRVYIYNLDDNTVAAAEDYQGNNENRVVVRVSWSSDDNYIIGASYNAEVWTRSGVYSHSYPFGSGLYDTAQSNNPISPRLVGGAADRSIVVWNTEERFVETVLEGHTGDVKRVSFTDDNRFLISTSYNEARIWLTDGWKQAAKIRIGRPDTLAVDPTGNNFAVESQNGSIQIWEIDSDKVIRDAAENQSVTYTSAKIVLVGDSGVGKTGLGWRLAHGNFKEHSSTHGQQFWLLHDAAIQRADGTYCEAVLWDLAGQPDYRLVHALFIDDADLALLVFDPTHANGATQGTGFWIKQLNLNKTKDGAEPHIRAALVAARCDRGSPNVTIDELQEYAQLNGLDDVFLTSASTGSGLESLGSGLVDHSQKMTVAARATAAKKAMGQRS